MAAMRQHFCLVWLILCFSPAFSHPLGKEKVAHLHFFLNDILSGDDPTAVLVARPDKSVGAAATPFGSVYATDDPLTDAPGGNVIGNARGLWVSTGKQDLSLVLIMDFGFTSGPYNGSSISVFSRNEVPQPTRELAVVGGRGKFRLARGFAEVKTYSLNTTNGDAILEYNEFEAASFRPGKEKLTRLHFYFHDVVSGNTPTSVTVAQAAATNSSLTQFGVVRMADDPLTEGPDPNSTLVGRAQGLYGSADQENVGLLMAINFAFSAGKYNGSTLTVLGRNPAMDDVREMPVVGGTVVFRFARGYAVLNTYSLDLSTGDAVVEYNVTVSHR
ncbi:hypothetical protein H6P81_018452 [Aristolochia fimbriata]|uniref:Dirigent protein n=1 Tax=Aristolochia fimbriata TaxID=158543 RepID=A0AAV7E1F3_ARIFI|nr:hypothetical protein H6P81_018452 [Aristolochia fimbriata]